MKWFFFILFTTFSCAMSLAQHQPVHIPIANPTAPRFLEASAPITRMTHRVWKTDHGLPQNSATAVCQTRDGYLWIGTEEGLVRFDGIRFTTFNKTNTPAFKNHWVNEILEVPNGNGIGYTLWLGTLGGLVRLSNGVFTSFTTNEGLPSNNIVSLLRDRSGALWIGTRGGGLSRYTNNSFTNYSTASGLASNFVHGLAQGRDGALWIGLDGKGVQKFQNGIFTHYSGKSGLSNENVWGLLIDSSNAKGDIVWIATNGGGVNRLENGVFTAITTKDGLSNNIVTSFWREKNGTLWIGTWGGGVNRLSNGVISRFTNQEGLSDNVVLALSGDREGALWVGTQGGGINQLQTGTFTTYTARDGLVGDFAVCFAQSQKRVNPSSTDAALWMGTYNGLSRYQNGIFTNYTTKDGLASNNIHSLWQDSSNGGHGGALWIGTWGGGVNCLLNGKFTSITTSNGLLNNIVTSVKPDEHTPGALWVGTWGGVNRLVNGKITESYTVNNGLRSNFVFTLLAERQRKVVWIGTWGGGLHRLENGVMTAFTDTNGLSSNFVRSIMHDADGVLWVGTVGGGLNRFHKGKWTSYTTHNGLFDDHIWTMVEDTLGWMWMSCNRGVFRVRKAELNAFAEGKTSRIGSQAFGKADGMKNAECNGGTPGSIGAADGRLYFPTAQGVVAVEPDKLLANSVVPPVIIEQILADSLLVDVGAPFTLPAETKKFEFSYTATSLSVPEKVQFKYLLEGYDKDWTSVGTRRVAYYTNLPRGRTYRFRVIACNNDGVWNEIGAAAEFTLESFFWETWWFTALCAVSVGCIGFGAYTLRVRRLHNRAAHFEHIVQERTVELRDANSEIQRQLEIQTTQAREIELANTHLHEMNLQLDQTLRELQETQTQLVASERIGAIGMLASGIMHEINNPNAGVYGALEQIHHKLHNLRTFFLSLLDEAGRQSPEAMRFTGMTDEMEKMLNLALNGSARVKNIVGTLRGFTKYHAEGIKYDSLERELPATIEIFGFQYNNVRVETAFIGDSSIKANFGEINQVFLNLLVNAAQAGATHIHLSSESTANDVTVRLSDDGKGIPPEVLPRMFEPFFTTKGAGNSGLGLSIGKKILERHGAEIHVDSVIGTGTTFTITFTRNHEKFNH
jgi:signal transduction histidine kinase/ligand-binding sensor domain-containing protein